MLKIQLEITGINYILKYILKKETVILNNTNISKFYCFCCTLDQINTGLVSRRDFFKKTLILLFKNICLVV